MRSIKLVTTTVAALALVVLILSPLSALADTPQQGDLNDSRNTLAPGQTIPASAANNYVIPEGSFSGTSRVTAPQSYSGDFGCSFSSLDQKMFATCIASIVYYIGPGLASWVASTVAYYFDLVVKLSLNSTAYALDFITTGWSLVLNLANMFFIFILIYTAFVIMLKAETTRTMQTLAWVIAIALVVNFSFFFTRVVIDAGNILAVQFYNAVAEGAPLIGNGTPDITANIMDALKVQQLLGPASFSAAQAAAGDSVWGGLIISTMVYISVAFVLWLMAITFITVGIKFMLRIVGLWFVIISSPLAFVSKTLHQTEGYYNSWQDMLIKFSFYPVIFLFMFLILNKFVVALTGGNLVNEVFNGIAGAADASSGAPLAAAIANVFIRMSFIVAIFYIALKTSDWVVHEGSGVAHRVVGYAGTALRGGSGLALRGSAATTGWAGRKTAGRIATKLSKSPTIAAGALQTGLRGMLWRGAEKTTKKFASGTYDVRNAPGAGLVNKVFEKTTGVSLNVGKAAAKGFAEQSKELREKNDKERKERSAIVKDAATKETIKRVVAQSKTGTPHDPKDVDRLKNVSKREIENLKMADLENIAHILTAPQLKTVTDGDKFTDEEKEKLRIVWNEKSSDAPLIKAQKIVTNELRDLVRTMGTVGITLSTVAANTAVGRTMDGGAVGAMKTEVANEIAKVTSAIRKAPTGTDTTDEQKQLATLNNGLEALKKLDEERKKVPANVGAHIDEGKFLVT